MNLPTVDAVNALRISKFKQRVIETANLPDAKALRPVVERLEAETGLPLIDIAAALASLSQGGSPLLLGGTFEPTTRTPEPQRAHEAPRTHEPQRPPASPRVVEPQVVAKAPRPPETHGADAPPRKARPRVAGSSMETFRIEVGSAHGIKPSNVVGAIANESGIEGVHIGRIDIREDHSFVDLPEGMPKSIFKLLQKVLVAGRELRISRVAEEPSTGRRPEAPSPRIASARKSVERAPVERKMLSRRPTSARGKKV
jgi:ATP-dependent RNA helicase DeaD